MTAVSERAVSVGNAITNFFWLTVPLTGVGAFIEFWLGKPGQQKVKDWLERQWYALSDIRLECDETKTATNVLYCAPPGHFTSLQMESRQTSSLSDVQLGGAVAC